MARGFGPVVVMLAAGLAADAAAMSRPVAAVQRFVLANGLTVVLAPNSTVPLVGVKLQYRVGMRDEPESRPGIATLAQRLMVRATMHVGEGDYDRHLDAAGAFDAGWRTSLDHSSLWVTVPPEELALPLWMWSDQMGFFAGRLDERLLAQQMTVTKNERVQLRENGPAASVPDLIAAELFPAGHPYRAGRIRGTAGLQGLTVRELRAFVESHYTPDQAILVLAGAFDPDRARSLIDRYFGSLPRAHAPPRRSGA